MRELGIAGQNAEGDWQLSPVLRNFQRADDALPQTSALLDPRALGPDADQMHGRQMDAIWPHSEDEDEHGGGQVSG